LIKVVTLHFKANILKLNAERGGDGRGGGVCDIK